MIVLIPMATDGHHRRPGCNPERDHAAHQVAESWSSSWRTNRRRTSVSAPDAADEHGRRHQLRVTTELNWADTSAPVVHHREPAAGARGQVVVTWNNGTSKVSDSTSSTRSTRSSTHQDSSTAHLRQRAADQFSRCTRTGECDPVLLTSSALGCPGTDRYRPPTAVSSSNSRGTTRVAQHPSGYSTPFAGYPCSRRPPRPRSSTPSRRPSTERPVLR